MSGESMFALVSRLSRDLDAEGIVHALTGSIAAGLHGEPVTSLDIDIVVNMNADTASRLAQRWERDLCADEYSFRQAAESHGIASGLHFPSGLKVDVSVLPDTPYYREVMQRRIRFSVSGLEESFWVVTSEDIILMKLWWRRESRSAKQWANALSVVRIKGHQLDWTYLKKWARELGVADDLDQLAREAGV
jgi:hypothetical protein